jgi:hypothetical protein
MAQDSLNSQLASNGFKLILLLILTKIIYKNGELFLLFATVYLQTI